MRESSTLLSSLLKLHNWRQSFNGEQVGYGYDPYRPKEKYHYAEAYALWGQGYLVLFKLADNAQFLEIAEICANWLLQHPKPGYERVSWGLPWEWDAWKAPSGLSYGSTTIFCGHFLIDLYELTGRDVYLEKAKAIAEWITSENGGERTRDGLWLYYANFPPLQFPVINVTAMASGYFARLYHVIQNESYRDLCIETASYIFNKQNQDGSWPYSDQSSHVDNIHTGYTLEGLWFGCDLFEREQWRRDLRLGTQFYWSKLFAPNGYGADRLPYGWHELFQLPIKSLMRELGVRVKFWSIPEAPLWAYGSALRTFAIQSGTDWLDRALIIYGYVQQNLALSDGSFAYRKSDRNAYIRHQAHIFMGMARLAQRLKPESDGQ